MSQSGSSVTTSTNSSKSKTCFISRNYTKLIFSRSTCARNLHTEGGSFHRRPEIEREPFERAYSARDLQTPLPGDGLTSGIPRCSPLSRLESWMSPWLRVNRVCEVHNSPSRAVNRLASAGVPPDGERVIGPRPALLRKS